LIVWNEKRESSVGSIFLSFGFSASCRNVSNGAEGVHSFYISFQFQLMKKVQIVSLVTILSVGLS
jgi:hypothetical protein